MLQYRLRKEKSDDEEPASSSLQSQSSPGSHQGGKNCGRTGQPVQVHPGQIRAWKAEALKGLEVIFADKRRRQDKDKSQEQETQELYRQIGKLKVEVDWLKKKSGLPG